MKKGIALMLGLILATFATASVNSKPDKPDCRESLAKINEKLSLNAQIEQDLLQGVWVQQTGESLETLAQFNNSGEAVFLNAIKMGSVYETDRYSWSIKVVNKDPFLVLRNLRTQETYQLLVEQTCQGIDLTNVATGHYQSYRYLPAAEHYVRQQQNALMGRWENQLTNVTLTDTCNAAEETAIELDQVSFRFEFRADGTFSRTLSSSDSVQRFEDQGRWELSKDGKRLFLHCKDSSGKTVTQCAMIKYLEMDELVLEQPLAILGKQFASSDNDTFFFNKN